MSDISIIGSGVVGEVIGAGFEKLGFNVIFYDVDQERVDELSERGLKSTSKIEEAINN